MKMKEFIKIKLKDINNKLNNYLNQIKIKILRFYQNKNLNFKIDIINLN